MNILLLNVKLLTSTLSELKEFHKNTVWTSKNDLEGRFVFRLTNLLDQSCALFDKLGRKRRQPQQS